MAVTPDCSGLPANQRKCAADPTAPPTQTTNTKHAGTPTLDTDNQDMDDIHSIATAKTTPTSNVSCSTLTSSSNCFAALSEPNHSQQTIVCYIHGIKQLTNYVESQDTRDTILALTKRVQLQNPAHLKLLLTYLQQVRSFTTFDAQDAWIYIENLLIPTTTSNPSHDRPHAPTGQSNNA